ncbi:MAG: tetratricopeptide repeat protein [Endomicrobia bacterium]|nr:tetratricopeptide repeat protein [Endomicrobiia bacterium]
MFDYVHFDDNELVLKKIDVLKNYKNIPKYFFESVGTGFEKFYRPALNLSFAVDSFVSGANPFFYHLTNVILHIIAVILMFVLLNRFNFNRNAVYFFTLLFAVHPAFVQAVAWIPGRNDTLIAIFAFASLVFLQDYLDFGRKNIKIVLFFLMCLSGFFTKETMLVMVAIVPIFMFLFCKNILRRDYFMVMTGLLALSGIYFAARFYVLSGLGASAHTALIDVKNSLPLLLSYIEFAIIPARIYLFNVAMLFDFLTLASLIIFIIPLISVLFFKDARKRVIIFGAFWFIIFMLPSFASPVETKTFYSHRLYLASFGIVIMFLEFCTFLLQKHEFLKKYFVVLFSVLICMFSISSYWQSKKFANRLYFLSSALIESPDLAVVRSHVAAYYIDSGEFAKAKKEALLALAIASNDKDHYENSGEISLELGPKTIVHYENLGYVYMLEKNYDKAKEVFENALKYNSESEKSLYNLSRIYYITGDIENSYILAQRLVFLFPNKDYNEYYLVVKEVNDAKIIEK